MLFTWKVLLFHGNVGLLGLLILNISYPSPTQICWAFFNLEAYVGYLFFVPYIRYFFSLLSLTFIYLR